LKLAGKLREQRAEPPGRGERVDAAAEGIEVGVVGPGERVEQRPVVRGPPLAADGEAARETSAGA
jgi:hypothetical protein